MKQGSGRTTDSARKVEPKSMGINPGAVSQIGNHVGPPRAIEPMHEGRGLKAPMVGTTQHHTGSQGKHR